MILLTGAAGFIGSCLLQYLNELGEEAIIIVDDFGNALKNKNLHGKKYQHKVHRDQLFDWLAVNGKSIRFVYHLGARTDTTEKNKAIFDRLNVTYSKKIWKFCSQQKIPLIYASSAATYGLGEFGYEDNHLIVNKLSPLNPYGDSKNDFDKWALTQLESPLYWAGLKFFNVYGPNEYHKGRMASVIFHTFHQIQQTGGMKLFRSHRSDYQNGQQSRDFIYVKDVVKVCAHFLNSPCENGLYNVGTGNARSFWDLAANTFKAMDKITNISFIDTPSDIRDTYQYFTKANISKLRAAGYDFPFYALEAGVADYVKNYLLQRKFY